MREIISYPVEVPKGLINVELFENGTKVEGIETNNFISKSVRDYMFKHAIKSLFMQNKQTNGKKIYDELGDPFRILELTDADHQEDPENEWLLKGNQIGYAYSNNTYSGSDKLRGTYNAAESYTNLDKVRMVFDFPTHAANGVFRSIYFRDENRPPILSVEPRPFLKEGPGVMHCKKYNDEIWVLHSSSSSSSGSSSSSSISRYDLDFNLIETYKLLNNVFDFEIHEGNIYFVGDNYTRGVQRASISNPKNVITLVNSFINTNETIGGIVFDEKNNQFVVSSSSSSGSSSSSSSISRYDLDFNLIETKNYTTTDGGYYYQKLVYVDGVILVNGYYDSYLLSNDDITNNNAAVGLVMGVIDDKKVMRDGTAMPKLGISSRCLLDAPIEKKSNQTMKITYDFILE